MPSSGPNLARFMLATVSPSSMIGVFVFGDILLTALNFHFVPELSRHDIFFSVTVERGYRKTEAAKRTLRQFRVAMWMHTGIALAIVIAGSASLHFLIPLLGFFWQVGGTTVAFLRAR